MKRALLVIFSLLLLYQAAYSAEGEKVVVDLPKTIYIAGETVLFKFALEWEGRISPSKIAYVELVDRSGQSMAQEIIRIEESMQDGYLDIPDHIISDNYLLRIYSRMGIAHPEYIFHQFITVINPQRPPNPTPLTGMKSAEPLPKRTVNLLEKSVYGTKEKVNFTLPEGHLSNISISVRSRNPFIMEEHSRRLKKNIYKDQKNNNWIPELYGHVVQAISTRSPIDTTETFFLSAHGRQSMLYTAKPNSQGELYFDLGSLDDLEYLIVQSAAWKEPLQALVESPFPIFQFDEDFSFPELHLDPSYLDFILDLVAAKEVATYFYLPAVGEGNQLVTGVYPDEVYLLDDYNRFDEFSTTVREFIPKVRVRRQDRETVFKVFNDPRNTVFDRNPLILLDAMPVFDSQRLADFNPENIKSLSLIYRDYYLNKDVFPGVISLRSYNNNLGGFPISDHALYIPYKGPQRARSYSFPLGQTEQLSSFLPDFRTVLYWEYEKDNQSIESSFYTSEVSGLFEIRVNFIDADGNERELTEWFEVEEKRIQIND